MLFKTKLGRKERLRTYYFSKNQLKNNVRMLSAYYNISFYYMSLQQYLGAVDSDTTDIFCDRCLLSA